MTSLLASSNKGWFLKSYTIGFFTDPVFCLFFPRDSHHPPYSFLNVSLTDIHLVNLFPLLPPLLLPSSPLPPPLSLLGCRRNLHRPEPQSSSSLEITLVSQAESSRSTSSPPPEQSQQMARNLNQNNLQKQLDFNDRLREVLDRNAIPTSEACQT